MCETRWAGSEQLASLPSNFSIQVYFDLRPWRVRSRPDETTQAEPVCSKLLSGLTDGAPGQASPAQPRRDTNVPHSMRHAQCVLGVRSWLQMDYDNAILCFIAFSSIIIFVTLFGGFLRNFKMFGHNFLPVVVFICLFFFTADFSLYSPLLFHSVCVSLSLPLSSFPLPSFSRSPSSLVIAVRLQGPRRRRRTMTSHPG